jgi:hypothetical protein
MLRYLPFLFAVLLAACSAVQVAPAAPPASPVSEVPAWSPDLGNGQYQNPILHADYSDPDVIRVGDMYYLARVSGRLVCATTTASSGSSIPIRILVCM